MTFLERALGFLAIAAWLPSAVGVVGRACVFKRDPHEHSRGEPERIPEPADADFAIADQEPREGDDNFGELDDNPLPVMTTEKP